MKDKLFAIPGINYPHPKNMAESILDADQYPHNLKGPALVSHEKESYYYTHGIQWSDEEYENFIRREIIILEPNLSPENYPFSQLESIVLAAKGFNKRAIFKETISFSGIVSSKGGSSKTVGLSPFKVIDIEGPYDPYRPSMLPAPYDAPLIPSPYNSPYDHSSLYINDSKFLPIA